MAETADSPDSNRVASDVSTIPPVACDAQVPLESPGALPKVLIAHDFAETYGGAERIIATAAAVLPGTPLWAIAGRQSVAERMGVGDRFHTVLPRSETLLRHYRRLAPAYPAIVRLRPAAPRVRSSRRDRS